MVFVPRRTLPEFVINAHYAGVGGSTESIMQTITYQENAVIHNFFSFSDSVYLFT